jgi:hypothetical protein
MSAPARQRSGPDEQSGAFAEEKHSSTREVLPASGIFERAPRVVRGITAEEVAAELGAIVNGPVAATLSASGGFPARAAVYGCTPPDEGRGGALVIRLVSWLGSVNAPSMIPVPDYVRSWLGVRVVLAMPFQTIWRFGAFAVSYDDVTEATVKDLKHAAALVALRLEEADRRTKWPWRGIDI